MNIVPTFPELLSPAVMPVGGDGKTGAFVGAGDGPVDGLIGATDGVTGAVVGLDAAMLADAVG